jgi:hypothetical protein
MRWSLWRRSRPSCPSRTPTAIRRLNSNPSSGYMHLPVSELFNYNVDRNGSLFSNCSDGTGEFGALLLQEYLNLQARVSAKEGGAGGGRGGKSSFLKSSTTTLLHNLNQAEKSSYVAHINTYLREDPFLKKYLPMDPSGNQLFDLIRDGVLLWLDASLFSSYW